MKGGSFIKVPDAEVDALESALSEIGVPDGTSVDMDLGYPCVQLPWDANEEDYWRVKKALQQAGFEVS